MKECPHENTEYLGESPKMKYILDTGENIPVPDLFVHYERCSDCGEVRKEVFSKEIEITKNEYHGEHKFIAREEYYTNGGSLVQKDGFGNWYFNGKQMTGKQLKQHMNMLGDSFGDQNVSDTFKELAHAARRKAEEKRFNKTKRLEEIRDEWQ